MSQKGFHKDYVAPLLVTLVSSLLLALGGYFWSRMTASSPDSPSPAPVQEAGLTFPQDTATRNLLREFLADYTTATAKYSGQEVQIMSLVALVNPGGVVELYGATEKNEVEGIYFECRLANGGVESSSLCRKQLVTIRGKVASYVHHRKSPRIVLEACSVVRP
jgi:hypothetical protein